MKSNVQIRMKDGWLYLTVSQMPRTEDQLWDWLRLELANYGHKLVKANPQKDGHMMTAKAYLRPPKRRSGIVVWDPEYAVSSPLVRLKRGSLKFRWTEWEASC